MYKKHLVIILVFILFISHLPFSVRSDDIENIYAPRFTNDLIYEIDTPSIEPGNEGNMMITLKNPYTNDMEDIKFTVNIYWYSYLDVDKNISEVEEPPVFDNRKTYSTSEIGDLSNNETEELEYLITTSEDTEEGVYSISFTLEFSMEDEPIEMNSNSVLPESTFEVRDPLPRWPQYALGIITTVSGVLAVMFYMQEKYNSFPKLEKTFDNWTGKFKKFRSSFKERFKKP